MANRNETLSRSYKFLNEDYFQKLYEAFIEAFSDYVIPFALTDTQFRNHINLNGVELERTVGCFEDDRLIGFSLNGFGEWEGRQTVYDAGTGVNPGFRRRGISEAMFEMMIPKFKAEGIQQWLLEVITTNNAALSLYGKLGFNSVRELAVLQFDGHMAALSEMPQNIEIRDIDDPDWSLRTTFWDGRTSWQNSVAAIERSRKMKRIIGAFSGGKCVGYIIFSSVFGRVAQIAVEKDHRNRGIGTALMLAMQAATAEGFPLQIINIDKSLSTAMDYFKNRGFYENVGQYEMKMEM
ncbi:MAG: GNAT family N-acetyltransferase [Chloracidobacterium sp.]|nr:GNAT family N-acetyltransferase [Chloracidobacterium sp.]